VNNFAAILLLASLCLLSSALPAQQTLNADTTWNGSIVISEKITLAPRKTLYLKPGSRVIFQGQGSLQCQGKLIANDVVFLAEEGRMPGIAIQGEGEMHFNYCQFQDFSQGGGRYNLFLQITRGRLFLQGCHFIRCAAIEYLYAGGQVEHCLFQDNQGIALHLYHAKQVQVRYSTFWGGPKSTHLLQLYAAQRCQVRDCFFYGGTSALRLGYGAKENLFSYLNLHNQTIGVDIHGNDNKENLLQNLLVTDSRSVAVRLESAAATNLFVSCIFFRSHIGAINASQSPGVSFRQSIFLQHKNLLLGKDPEQPDFQDNVFWETKLPTELAKLLLKQGSKNRQEKPALLNPEKLLFSAAGLTEFLQAE